MSLKIETIKCVAAFIIANKGTPCAERPKLVQELTDSILANVIAARGSRECLWMWKMRHPDLMKKEGAPYHSITDILADWIMDIDQVAERDAEYPVYNAEKVLRDDKAREVKEARLLLDEDRRDTDSDWPSRVRTGVMEDAFNANNLVENALFGEPQMSDAELSAALSRVKSEPASFIRRYADGSAWNRDDTGKRRTPANVRRAIGDIEVRRVKPCIVCGNGFYSHTIRQKICDVMLHPKQISVSFCQYERDKTLAIMRKKSRTRVRIIEPFSNI